MKFWPYVVAFVEKTRTIANPVSKTPPFITEKYWTYDEDVLINNPQYDPNALKFVKDWAEANCPEKENTQQNLLTNMSNS